MQETFCTAQNYIQLDNDFNGEIYHSLSDSPHSRGVSILFRRDFEYTFLNSHFSIDGRKIIVNFKHKDETFSVSSVYAPNDEKLRIIFFKNAQKWVRQHSVNEHSIILCGDFNCAMENIDRNTNKVDKSVFHLKNFNQHLNLNDSFRELNPTLIKYTYSNASASFQSRIDYIFISNFLKSSNKNCIIKQVPKIPDHKAVIITLKIDNSRGNGYWKLNNKWLQNEIYCESIKVIINETCNEYNWLVDKRLIWDLCKIKIKEFSIKFAVNMTRQRNAFSKILENDINRCEHQLSTTTTNNSDKKDITALKYKLKKLHNEEWHKRNMGSFVRSRFKWITESDQNPNFFKSIETKRQLNNRITGLLDNDNKITNNTQDILKIAKTYYEELFTTKNIDRKLIKDYLNSVQLNNTLSKTDSELCDEDLSEVECFHALSHNMKSNKAPGHDGIPVEFYKQFWTYIKEPLMASFTYGFKVNELSYSHREAIISLMFKKNDRSLLKNYRPISLSNVDYKIIAFVLSNRLHTILDKIISPQQTAYVKKRFIGENIRQMEDILEYTSKMKIPGLVLFLDFEKAFDSLEWNFLDEVLKKFGFSDKFIKYINTIYNKPFACIKINGYLTERFNILRGVKQGCPLSAILFILCTEVLARAIVSNDDIKGITIPNRMSGKNKTYKLSQYADDMSLFLESGEQVLNALDVVIAFGQVSGLKLNLEKTEGMWIGSLFGSNTIIEGIKWPRIIRYLGVYIGPDIIDCQRKNWDDKLLSFQKLLDCWRSKNITLFSKVNFIKTFAISKLVFPAIMLPLPSDLIKRVEKLIFNFVWGKQDKIRRRSLICPLTLGGLNMIDVGSFFQSLKATWIHRFRSDKDWTFISNYHMNKLAPLNIILKMSFQDLNEMQCLCLLPKFYQEILLSYCRSRPNEEIESKSILYNQLIWGNRSITYENKCLYSLNMINANIVFLKDVLLPDGKINPTIYENLKNKADYFRDITLITKSMRKYRTLMNSDQPVYVGTEEKVQIFVKSKPFYELLKSHKQLLPKSLHFWMGCFPEFNFGSFYKNKLHSMHVAKIKEFLFKTIHNISVCGEILFRWKIIHSKKCIYCDYENHTFKHMILECIHCTDVWNFMNDNYDLNLDYRTLILGIDNNLRLNNLISVIMYLIYKKYLNDKDNGSDVSLIHFIKTDVEFKSIIYILNDRTSEEYIPLQDFLTKLNIHINNN